MRRNAAGTTIVIYSHSVLQYVACTVGTRACVYMENRRGFRRVADLQPVALHCWSGSRRVLGACRHLFYSGVLCGWYNNNRRALLYRMPAARTTAMALSTVNTTVVVERQRTVVRKDLSRAGGGSIP